jgi:hypothetical protein
MARGHLGLLAGQVGRERHDKREVLTRVTEARAKLGSIPRRPSS